MTTAGMLPLLPTSQNRAAKVADAVGPILADINLPIWACNFVDDIHR
jgi:hypothetical protein